MKSHNDSIFGPHTLYQLDDQERVDRGLEPDKLVKTHCCFCGQQCGMQLKVHDNKVIGIEPWEEFPFNKGMLCPKVLRDTFKTPILTDSFMPTQKILLHPRDSVPWAMMKPSKKWQRKLKKYSLSMVTTL